MIEVGGKSVLTELHELVDPSRTAVVVVDMQRDFVEPDGLFGSLGLDLEGYAEMRPRLRALLDAARAAGVRILHLRNTSLPDGASDSPAQIRFNMRMHEAARAGGPPLSYTVPGTDGYEFVDDVGPRPGEVVVQKYRSSGFWGTNLDLVLRSNGIETVIVCGCTTEGCVDSTARDAMFSNYYVVIPRDCVASDDRAQHEASLLLMQHRFDVVSSEDVTALWAGGTAA